MTTDTIDIDHHGLRNLDDLTLGSPSSLAIVAAVVNKFKDETPLCRLDGADAQPRLL